MKNSLVPPFPSLERPLRCLISSVQFTGKHLSCHPDGRVYVSDKKEEWILKQRDDGSVKIVHAQHSMAIESEPDAGQVRALKEDDSSSNIEWRDWSIERLLPEEKDDNKTNDYYVLRSMSHNRYLNLSSYQDAFANPANRDELVQTSRFHWKVTFLTGELCFLSKKVGAVTKCLSYASPNIFSKSSLIMREQRKASGVWRFIPNRDGSVTISPFACGSSILYSNSNGNVNVCDADKAGLVGTKWRIRLAPRGLCGVTIQNTLGNRFLSIKVGDGEDTIACIDHVESNFGVWQLDAAHQQRFRLLSSSRPDTGIGSSAQTNELVPTKAIQECVVWTLSCEKNNLISLYSEKLQKYMSVVPDIYMTQTKNEHSYWELALSPHDGLYLTPSNCGGRKLSWHDKGVRLSTGDGPLETWLLVPVPPESESSLNPIQIGIIASTALAAPFAFTGAVGLLGFTAQGIAKGSVAAWLMSLWGGAVPAGGLVATLQSIGVLGLGTAGMAGALGVGATAGIGVASVANAAVAPGNESSVDPAEVDIKQQYFCQWKSWPDHVPQ